MHFYLFSNKDDFRGRPQRHSSAYSEDDYEPAPGVMGGAGLLYRRRQQTEREVEEVYDVDDEVRFCCTALRNLIWIVLHGLFGFTTMSLTLIVSKTQMTPGFSFLHVRPVCPDKRCDAQLKLSLS